MLGSQDLITAVLNLLPERTIAASPHWTSAVNRNQNLLGKVVLVARRPLESVTGLDPDEWSDLQPDQYHHAFLMNLDVQVHIHVVPRYRRPRTSMGEVYADPHFGELFGTEQQILDRGDLAGLADMIRDRLPSR